MGIIKFIKVSFVLALLTTFLMFYFSMNQSNTISIEAKTQRFMQELKLPGVAISTIAIVDSGQPIIRLGTFGYTNLKKQKPVRPDSTFLISSISKTMIGFAIAKVIDEGLLSLDDDVNEILAKTNAPIHIDHLYKSKITIRDLVTHRSGIIDTEALWNTYLMTTPVCEEANKEMFSLYNFYNPEKPKEQFNQLKEQNLLNLKGMLRSYLQSDGLLYSEKNFSAEGPKYSNIASALAGYLVEEITKMPLADYISKSLLKPLDMRSTLLNWLPGDPDNNMVTQYLTKNGQTQAIPMYGDATWPEGGIRSSIEDMSKYLSTIMQAYLSPSGNDHFLLSKESLGLLLNPQAQLSEQESIGIFWQTQKLKLSGVECVVIGHDGSSPGAFSFMLFDPKEKIGIIILANGEEGTDAELLLNFIADLFVAARTISAERN